MSLKSCNGRKCEVMWCDDCDRCYNCCEGWTCEGCEDYFCGQGDEGPCGNCEKCEECCGCIYCERCEEHYSPDDREWCGKEECCSECCKCSKEGEKGEKAPKCRLCGYDIDGYHGNSPSAGCYRCSDGGDSNIHYCCCRKHSEPNGNYHPRARKEVKNGKEVIRVDYENDSLPN